MSKQKADEQHSLNKINRQHVIETSIAFLNKQVKNQRLHVANLLAKTGDTDSYAFLQDVFLEIENALEDIGADAIDEVREYYSSR